MKGNCKRKEYVEGWERRSMSLSGRVRKRRHEGKGCLRFRVKRTSSGMHNKMVWATWQWEETTFLISASVRNPSQHGQEKMLHGSFCGSDLCCHGEELHKDQLFSPMPIFLTLLFTLGTPSWWLSQLTVWTWPAEGMRWFLIFQIIGWKDFALQWCCCGRWWVLGTASWCLDQRHGCNTLKMSKWVPEQIPRDSIPLHWGKCCSSCYFPFL